MQDFCASLSALKETSLQSQLTKDQSISNDFFPHPETSNNMWYDNLDLYLSTNEDTASLRILNKRTELESSENDEGKIIGERHFNPTDKRYEVPSFFFNASAKAGPRPHATGNLTFTHENSPFSFQLKHPDDEDTVVLSTVDQDLIFMDKYIDMSFLVNGQHVFGYGERVNSFFLQEGNYSLYAQ